MSKNYIGTDPASMALNTDTCNWKAYVDTTKDAPSKAPKLDCLAQLLGVYPSRRFQVAAYHDIAAALNAADSSSAALEFVHRLVPTLPSIPADAMALSLADKHPLRRSAAVSSILTRSYGASFLVLVIKDFL